MFNKWDNRPYYGNLKNNLKSTYIRNLGWFDGNAAKLATYPDAERGERYVEAFGGEQKVIDAALNSFNKGDYRFATELLNNVVASNPENKQATFLMADALEQLGYQDETTLTRNLYLSGAQELRMGGNVPNNLSTASPEVIAALSGDMLMPYLGMIIDQVKAEKVGNYVINLNLADDKQFTVDLHNGVFNTLDVTAKNADVTLDISKPDLLTFLAGKISMNDLMKSNKVKVDGDAKVLDHLPGLFDLNIKNDMNLVLPLQADHRIK